MLGSSVSRLSWLEWSGKRSCGYRVDDMCVVEGVLPSHESSGGTSQSLPPSLRSCRRPSSVNESSLLVPCLTCHARSHRLTPHPLREMLTTPKLLIHSEKWVGGESSAKGQPIFPSTYHDALRRKQCQCSLISGFLHC